MNKQEHLKQMIDLKRKKMTRLAFLRGFTDEKTVQCSQELDVLLNQYNVSVNTEVA